MNKGNVDEDMASIFNILKQMSEETQSLKEIHKTTTSMEGKLSVSVLKVIISDVQSSTYFSLNKNVYFLHLDFSCQL